jgi:hypothetical protein
MSRAFHRSGVAGVSGANDDGVATLTAISPRLTENDDLLHAGRCAGS